MAALRAAAEATWLEDDAGQDRHPGPRRRTEDPHPRRPRLPLDHRGRRRACSSGPPPSAGGSIFGVSLGLLGVLGIGVAWLFWEGIGVWGLNNPVGWAWDITNFVFWVGIGHAGTLISAILFLFRQKWRTSINRFAEAMTHLRGHLRAASSPASTSAASGSRTGCSRCPNQMGMWPNFRSPLLWDVFAVSTYVTVSLLFWYVGPDPRPGDAARPRQDAAARRWSTASSRSAGAARTRHWQHYETRVPDPRRRSRRRWCSRCTRSCRSTSRPRSCPAGTPRSSRRTSSPAPSSPASRWW